MFDGKKREFRMEQALREAQDRPFGGLRTGNFEYEYAYEYDRYSEA